jgi:ParB/RepB/Spo0J family partition protein
MSTAVLTPTTKVPIDLIDLGKNVRDLDHANIETLAGSIALRGQLVPVIVRPDGERFTLVAGYRRYAACRHLGLKDIGITVSEQEEGSSADNAAENIVRQQLSPLGEARAVQNMLDEGYTLDGAAQILGWSTALVKARAKILALPETARNVLGRGELPVSAVDTLTTIAAVTPGLCEAAAKTVAEGKITAAEFARNPGYVIGLGVRGSSGKLFAEHLETLGAHQIPRLKLGKKADRAYAEADRRHRQLDRHVYGPPTIRFSEAEVDQARAAGVLIELERCTPIITDKALYRELARQAIDRTVQELKAHADTDDKERAKRRAKGKADPTPRQKLDEEHRASLREYKRRAHGTNLDLGSALLQKLATVDPGDMDVARFFAYGLLGPDCQNFGSDNHTVAAIAANGIRLVFDEHRTTTTPKLKSGALGKTKVTYGEVKDAAAWMWKFIEGAQDASELYGRVLVVFASQHYAQQLVASDSPRRYSVLPLSRKDTARKAFARITKQVLPATHLQLARAIEREARDYRKRQVQLETTGPGTEGGR